MQEHDSIEKQEDMIEKAKYIKPELDIEEQTNHFIEGIAKKDGGDKETLVKDFINNEVETSLQDWKARYRQNDEIIKTLQDRIDFEQQEIYDINKNKKALNENLTTVEQKLLNTNATDKEILSNDKKSKFHKKITLTFLLIVAFGLATLTAYKFATSMATLEYIETNQKHAITIFQYILYGFGSLAILASGKIISIIYEKLHMNKTFFIIIASTAITLAGISAFMLAQDKAFLTAQFNIQAQIKQIKTDKDDLGFNVSKSDPKYIKYSKEIEELRKKQRKYPDQAAKLNMFLLLLVLFTEMMVGGTTWMYVADYFKDYNAMIRDYKERKKELKSKITKMQLELKDLESAIEFLDKEEKVKLITNKIADLEDKMKKHEIDMQTFNHIIASIRTEQEIMKEIDNLINSYTNYALAKLWKINTKS